MPIPKPRLGEESEQEFIERCMSNDTMVDEYEQEQRSAICYDQWRERENAMSNLKQINFRINASDVRRETVQEREYLVAPVVAVKEGVLNYDDGAEFIPADEIKNSVDFWNGVDLPIGHPKQRGQPISAKSKVVVDKNAVGRMWNAHYEDKKLKGELWIDIEKAQNMGSDARQVINRLENGDSIDVSTAYVREIQDNPGQYDGQDYDRVQRDLRPDHLALLPDGTGNMSWSDGVGAPRINEDGDYMNFNEKDWNKLDEIVLSAYEKGLNLNNITGSENMADKSEALVTIVENTGFDAEDFEDLSDEQVEVWAEAYNETPDEGEEDESEVTNDDGEDDGIKLEDKVENQAEEIENLKAELKEQGTKLEEQEAEKREEKEKTIKENSDLSEEFIESLTNEQLEEEYKEHKPVDYRGQAGVTSNINSSDEVTTDEEEEFQEVN